MTSLEQLRELIILSGNQVLAHVDRHGNTDELDNAMTLMVRALDGLAIGLAVMELDRDQPTVQ